MIDHRLISELEDRVIYMETFLRWLSENPAAQIVVLIIILVVVVIYIIALIQGREVSFWPPKIGPKTHTSSELEKQKNSEGQAQDVSPLRDGLQINVTQNVDLSSPAEKMPQETRIFHNLPPRKPFVGREQQKRRGHVSLLPSSRPNITIIGGIGGVGKTSLALEIAKECLEVSKAKELSREIASFDGFVWTTAKDRELSLDNILDEAARTLNHPIVMKQPLEEKRNSVTRIFQDKPYLLIVDGFEAVTDPGTRDFLMDIPEPSKLLLTTRDKEVGDATIIWLEGLPDAEALLLIREHANKTLELGKVKNASDTELLELCKATKGNPLAIKWVLGRIKQKGQSLDAVHEFLDNAEGDIFDYIFGGSWELLSENARRILSIMPIFVDDTSALAIQAASNVQDRSFDSALGQLLQMSLINTTDEADKPEPHHSSALGQLVQMSPPNITNEADKSQPRYSIHPLTRTYVSKKTIENPRALDDATKDLACFFEDYTRKNGGLWNIHGFEMLIPDIPNIISVIRWCWRRGPVETGIDIFDNVRYFVMNHGLWNTALELAREAIKLFPYDIEKPPERLNEWQTKTVLFRVWPMAWIYRFRGDYKAAENEIHESLKLFEHVGDQRNIAYVKRHLSLVLQRIGGDDNMESADRLLREALEYSKATHDDYRKMLLEADLSELALKRGDVETAWQLSSRVHSIVCDMSLKATDDQGEDTYQKLQSISVFYRVLGNIAKQKGNLKQAREMCGEALRFTEQLKYRDGIADSLFALAQIDVELKRVHDARQEYERAYEIYKALGIRQRVREIENALDSLENYDANRDNE